MASNSTQIITDLTSALANAPYNATTQALANAPAGPITDLSGLIQSIRLNAQEMAEKIAYLVSGSMAQGSLTNPTGGIFTSGGLDSATYNLLVGIYQILK